MGMSRKERLKLMVMEAVESGRETLGGAAERLGLSYRQVRRVWRRYRESGAKGLVHRSRGRPSNRRRGEGERARIVAAYRERLQGYGPTLASEKLARWGHAVDAETLRRWLLAEGVWQRRRRRGPHRRWREPRRHFGELVQMDGSHHDWFCSGELCCLMNMVDDATGLSLARLEEQETTDAAMRLLWSWILRYGVPAALYVDRKTVYVTEREATAEEVLAGEEPLTAFGRACHRLGIRIITAHSAAAKGRVERKHGVYQDRLVKELALRGITTIAAANTLLEDGFVDELNARFAREPLEPQDVHRPVPDGVELAEVFVFEVTRTVGNDWTIRYENRWYQLTGPREKMPRPRAKVTLQRRLDGSQHIFYRGAALTFHEVSAAERVKPAAKANVATTDTPPTRETKRPSPRHPWRGAISHRAPRFNDRARRAAPSQTPP